MFATAFERYSISTQEFSIFTSVSTTTILSLLYSAFAANVFATYANCIHGFVCSPIHAGRCNHLIIFCMNWRVLAELGQLSNAS
jgi:hypothetical protein